MKYFPLVSAVILSTSLSHAAVLTFDFGEAGNTTSGINNITTSSLSVSNPVIDGGGTLSGVTVTLAGTSLANGNGTQNPTTGSNLAAYATSTTRDSMYGNTSTWEDAIRTTLTLSLAGLDGSGATTYFFEFAASRAGVSDNRQTQYAVAGLNNETVFLNAHNNTTDTASTVAITPTAGGDITITINKGPNNDNGTGFFYIGGMRVTTVPEPSSLMLGVAGMGLLLRRRVR